MLTFPNASTHHNAFERHHRFIGWLGLTVCDELIEHNEHWADRSRGFSLSLRAHTISRHVPGKWTAINSSRHKSFGHDCIVRSPAVLL
jgi:hypothetical protein